MKAQVEASAPASPFIGLWEAVAWVCTRDQAIAAAAAAEESREAKFARWITLAEYAERSVGSPEAALADLCALAATEEITAKGRYGAGYVDVPANAWIDAEIAFNAPDAFRPVDGMDTVLGSLWTHVRFWRNDIYRLWPPLLREVASTNLAPPGKPDAKKSAELAAFFDGQGIARRALRAEMIAERWDSNDGPAPTLEYIKVLMKGGKRGRPPAKV
ncbi:hypothetical protein [Sphingomonas sp. TZW2008]|uniref:hypothetical protein n=1 Tax=Sphingomonas sp. TZW2008 TaxID=1917973 RepID=UPI000A268950|nr:hypothetical protein [Sphingomonas sp. TZW2008]